MNSQVNRDVLMGKWKQIRGKVRRRWGKLTNNQIDQIGGDYERLVGVLQEKYGYARSKATHEADRWIDRVGRGSKGSKQNP
jgi:uncharacterized protein YjbJ (UPF0337 family)